MEQGLKVLEDRGDRVLVEVSRFNGQGEGRKAVAVTQIVLPKLSNSAADYVRIIMEENGGSEQDYNRDIRSAFLVRLRATMGVKNGKPTSRPNDV